MMPEDLFINGIASDKATQELQKSTNLQLSRNEKTGKVTASGEAKTIGDKKLLEVINSKSVHVEINATNKATTSDEGRLFVGGAFLGNTVKNTESGNEVFTKQDVNPNVLSAMSKANNSPGQDMLHEVTEAYEGGKVSQVSGKSLRNSFYDNKDYSIAHNRATPQSGVVFQNPNYSKNEVTYSTTKGVFPFNVGVPINAIPILTIKIR